jgi:uridine nucleosidase
LMLIAIGESGLDGTDLLPKPVRRPLSHLNAVKEMRDSLMACQPNTAWIVVTGTLTNLGLLMATFPEVAHHVKGVSIMGGAIGEGFAAVSMGPDYTDAEGKTRKRIGNYSPYAEFNIWCDPEASQSVFQNPVLKNKTYLIPLDVTHQAYAGKSVQDMLLNGKTGGQPTRMRRMYNELLMFFADTYKKVFGLTEGPPLHDPLAVAVLLWYHSDPSVAIDFDDRNGERWDISVITEGDQVGRTVATAAKEGSVIPRSLDLEKFWNVLEECMDRADEKTGRKV